MVWIGDIYIPFITEKDTSIERDAVEKNFVDSPPQVYELTPSFEAGTYSAILNETLHSRSESFEEQRDSTTALVERNPSQCPVEVGGDRGYISVESSTQNITPSNEMSAVDLELRFLEKGGFKPGFKLHSERVSEDFSVNEVSVLPIHSDVNSVTKNGEAFTPSASITSEDGTFDLYEYGNGDVISFVPLDTSFVDIARHSTVSLHSQGDKIYSTEKPVYTDYTLENGMLRGSFTSTDFSVSRYDSGAYNDVFTVDVGSETGYCPKNGIHEIEIENINDETVSMYRGLPVIALSLTGRETVNVQFSSVASSNSGNFYTTVTDGNGYDIQVIVSDSELDMTVNSGSLSISGMTPSLSHDVFIGVVPGGVSNSVFAQWIYSRGNWKETLIQKT